MNKVDLEKELSYCTGTGVYYKNPIFNAMYTDGVKCFAENAGGGAYWFLTDVFLFIRNARKNNPNEDMFAVHLVVDAEGRADLIYRDGDDNIAYKRHYNYTDCPEGDWVFFYFVGQRLLIWHGEY